MILYLKIQKCAHGDDGDGEEHDEDGAQRAEKAAVGIQQAPDRKVGAGGSQQQQTEQGQHDPAGGPELMLQ